MGLDSRPGGYLTPETLTPFSALIRDRAKQLNATHAEIAAWMSGRGIKTSRQSVHQWATGKATPEPWKLATLLDVLGVPEPHRGPWLQALETARPAEVTP